MSQSLSIRVVAHGGSILGNNRGDKNVAFDETESFGLQPRIYSYVKFSLPVKDEVWINDASTKNVKWIARNGRNGLPRFVDLILCKAEGDCEAKVNLKLLFSCRTSPLLMD